MAQMFGFTVPDIGLGGIISDTWMWVLLVVLLGIVLICVAAYVLFIMTYNRKIVIFENISGQGYQPTLKTRARSLKTGTGSYSLLKALRGQWKHLNAYGKKMGKNTYWFAIGQDGYPYNFVLGDLDAKMGMLDIEPIDRDVRGTYVVLDRLTQKNYGENTTMQKVIFFGSIFLMVVTFFIGMYVITGRIGEATRPLAKSHEYSQETYESMQKTLSQLDVVIRGIKELKGIEIVHESSNETGFQDAPG